jgi:hypothetical protein
MIVTRRVRDHHAKVIAPDSTLPTVVEVGVASVRRVDTKARIKGQTVPRRIHSSPAQIRPLLVLIGTASPARSGALGPFLFLLDFDQVQSACVELPTERIGRSSVSPRCWSRLPIRTSRGLHAGFPPVSSWP